METDFSVQKKTYSCLLRTLFSASGNHYWAYLKLLLQPFCFIFPIFLSVGTDFLFSRNSILLFTDFFRDFCKTTLLLLVEANFVASRDDFFLPFSDIPTTVSFVFLTDINVFLTRILHFFWWKRIFCQDEMKGFIEKLEKWRKKWFFTSQKISCALVILSSFVENCFPKIPIIVSTSRKNFRIKQSFQ